MPQQIPLLFFVINPISGGREKHDWEKAIRNYFENRIERTEFFLLTGNNDRSSIEHYISSMKPEKIIAVGGDGTVRLLAEIVYHLKIPLGILPAGSANGMAAELGIPNNMEEALNIIVRGNVKKTDILRINEKHICLHLSDLGLNAEMIKYFEKHPGRGKFNYARFLLKVLWFKKQLEVKISYQNGSLYRKAYMAVIANATKYGTGAVINPHGNIYDGVFEIIVLKKLSFRELLKMMFKKKSFNPKKTEIFTATELTIESKPAADFQIDGEYIGKISKVTVRIEKQVLKLLIPN